MLLSKVLNDYYVLLSGQSEIVDHFVSGGHIHIDWTDNESGEVHSQSFADQEVRLNPSCPVKGSFAVTTLGGDEMSFIALDGAALQPERLLVHLEGGLVQAVLSERTPFEVAIIDYDIEGADEDEISEIPQTDEGGGYADAVARIDTATVDPEFVAGAFASIN